MFGGNYQRHDCSIRIVLDLVSTIDLRVQTFETQTGPPRGPDQIRKHDIEHLSARRKVLGRDVYRGGIAIFLENGQSYGKIRGPSVIECYYSLGTLNLPGDQLWHGCVQ